MKDLALWERFSIVVILAVLVGGGVVTGCGLVSPLPERVHADLPSTDPQTGAVGEPTLADLLRAQAKISENLATLTATLTQLEETNKAAAQGLSAGEVVAGGTGASALIFTLLQLVRNGVFEERRKRLGEEITWTQAELEKVQGMIASLRGTPTAVPQTATS